MTMRIGLGFDAHPLVEGRPCILGGVELPHPVGPHGHSDGDAVLHAIIDALLGAAGLDDIGTMFPDTDLEWQGARSAQLLGLARERVADAGWHLVNIDVVIATDGPRIATHRKVLRQSIADLLDADMERVSVKGKSLEGLGAMAAGMGVAAQAVCLLERV